MNKLPICVIKYIFEYLDFESQIAFRAVNKTYYNKLDILIFSNYYLISTIKVIYKNFNFNILKQSCFKNIKTLKLHINDYEPSLNNLPQFNLTKLYLSSENAGNTLKLDNIPSLEYLMIENLIITNLDYVYTKVLKLELINCYIICNISNSFPEVTDLHILNCQFIYYYAFTTVILDFPKIKFLLCTGNGINLNTICKLNPEVLCIFNTSNIKCLKHMTRLKTIYTPHLDYEIPINCSLVRIHF